MEMFLCAIYEIGIFFITGLYLCLTMFAGLVLLSDNNF